MTLRTLIVDDEELARMRLRMLLADCTAPAADVVGEAASAAAALEWLRTHRADVLLLDIHLPGLDGLELARRLRQLPRMPAVVFVTAHAEHALAAFDVEAVDYLTKPVRRLRLQEALARVAQRLAPEPAAGPLRAAGVPAEVPLLRRDPTRSAPPAPAPAPLPSDEPVIVVPDRGGLVRVPLTQVLYLKAELKYVTVRTTSQAHLIEASLTELEPRLGERFVRIHRNAIVAKHAVRALQRHTSAAGDVQGGMTVAEAGDSWAVCVDPVGEWLTVSRRQLAAVREALAAEGL